LKCTTLKIIDLGGNSDLISLMSKIIQVLLRMPDYPQGYTTRSLIVCTVHLIESSDKI
jgi:hypothetical protein